MNYSGFITRFISILAVFANAAWICEARAENIDCSKAKSLDECRRVCDRYEPPEIDFTPPFSRYVKRYNDCLKKAYSTYRYPKYWFSDYKQTERYRAMFLTNLLKPTVSESKFSSCEGKNVQMPALIETWELGMLNKITGISGHKWINIEIPKKSQPDWFNFGSVAGNKNKYYNEVNIGAESIYAEPMNISESPELETEDITKNRPFELSQKRYEGGDEIDDLFDMLIVPSEDINMVSPYGQVIWSGFESGLSNFAAFIMRSALLNSFTMSSSKSTLHIDYTARYQYDERGLPKSITKYQLNERTQSFAETGRICMSFDEDGRISEFDNCCDAQESCKYRAKFLYTNNNLCPAGITINNRQRYLYEYDQNNRLVLSYDKSADIFRETRYYYQNSNNYDWNIKKLKFTYAKPIKSISEELSENSDGMKLFNPKDYHEMDYYEAKGHDYVEKHLDPARPFLMDLRPVTQGNFEKLMGRNPSYFGHGHHSYTAYETKSDTFNIVEYNADPRELPVESVTWYDALAYANERSKSEGLETCYVLDKCKMENDWYVCRNVRFKGLDCKGYRLPTWEEAKITVSDTPDIDRRAVEHNCIPFEDKGCLSTFSVETAKIDENGLYDRSGNIYEWVWDWYGPEVENYCLGNCEDEPKKIKNQLNSLGPTTGICRRVSGSSFITATITTMNDILCYPPDRGGIQLGFRLVRTVK